MWCCCDFRYWWAPNCPKQYRDMLKIHCTHIDLKKYVTYIYSEKNSHPISWMLTLHVTPGFRDISPFVLQKGRVPATLPAAGKGNDSTSDSDVWLFGCRTEIRGELTSWGEGSWNRIIYDGFFGSQGFSTLFRISEPSIVSVGVGEKIVWTKIKGGNMLCFWKMLDPNFLAQWEG